MAQFIRGFRGRGSKRDPRLPPRQYDIGDPWPVLTAEVTPRLETTNWTFRIEGLAEQPMTWTWDQIRALPASAYQGAIHCVTGWNALDHFLRVDPRDAGCEQAIEVLAITSTPSSQTAERRLNGATRASPPICSLLQARRVRALVDVVALEGQWAVLTQPTPRS
jgi:DMSO/TMAO reductase YedYZ molybdopterin-dependent catalytic subunit